MVCSYDASCSMRKMLFFCLRFFTKHQQSITVHVISQFLRGICTRRLRIYTETLCFTYLQANLVTNALPLFSTPRVIFASVNVCWMLTQLVITNTKALHIVFSLHQFTHPPSLSPPPTLVGCNLQSCAAAQLWAVDEFIALPCHAIASPWANRRRQCAHKQYAGKHGGAQHFRLTWWAASRVSYFRLASLGQLHLFCLSFFSASLSSAFFRSSAVCEDHGHGRKWFLRRNGASSTVLFMRSWVCWRKAWIEACMILLMQVGLLRVQNKLKIFGIETSHATGPIRAPAEIGLTAVGVAGVMMTWSNNVVDHTGFSERHSAESSDRFR